MKKMFIVAFIISAAIACGGKKKPTPTTPPDTGSATGSDTAPPADGSGSDAAPAGSGSAM